MTSFSFDGHLINFSTFFNFGERAPTDPPAFPRYNKNAVLALVAQGKNRKTGMFQSRVRFFKLGSPSDQSRSALSNTVYTPLLDNTFNLTAPIAGGGIPGIGFWGGGNDSRPDGIRFNANILPAYRDITNNLDYTTPIGRRFNPNTVPLFNHRGGNCHVFIFEDEFNPGGPVFLQNADFLCRVLGFPPASLLTSIGIPGAVGISRTYTRLKITMNNISNLGGITNITPANVIQWANTGFTLISNEPFSFEQNNNAQLIC